MPVNRGGGEEIEIGVLLQLRGKLQTLKWRASYELSQQCGDGEKHPQRISNRMFYRSSGTRDWRPLKIVAL